MTALMVWPLVLTFLNVLRELVPAVALFQSFIYALALWRLAGVTHREALLLGFGCPELVQVGRGVSEVRAPFVTTLASAHIRISKPSHEPTPEVFQGT